MMLCKLEMVKLNRRSGCWISFCVISKWHFNEIKTLKTYFLNKHLKAK